MNRKGNNKKKKLTNQVKVTHTECCDFILYKLEKENRAQFIGCVTCDLFQR